MGMSLEPGIQEKVIGNIEGDALDSLIAAFTTSLIVPRLDGILGHMPDICYLEGYTFL